MAVSKVSIANLGLQKLGASRISSLSQNHPNASSMSAAYDAVRQSELRKYEWNFATRRASLAADASQTVWGSHNRFSLPGDYLYLIRDDESGQSVDWTIESDSTGRFIVTDDAAPLLIKYIADIDDPSYYDSQFVMTMACALALQCCEEITQSTSKKQGIQKEYDDSISLAMQQGAIEKPATEFPTDEWINARL
jgi:hypothetical protein